MFGTAYPDPNAPALASEAGLGDVPEIAVLVAVAQKPGDDRLYANLLAPIVVDAQSRRAAQVVLDPERYSTATLVPTEPAAPSP